MADEKVVDVQMDLGPDPSKPPVPKAEPVVWTVNVGGKDIDVELPGDMDPETNPQAAHMAMQAAKNKIGDRGKIWQGLEFASEFLARNMPGNIPARGTSGVAKGVQAAGEMMIPQTAGEAAVMAAAGPVAAAVPRPVMNVGAGALKEGLKAAAARIGLLGATGAGAEALAGGDPMRGAETGLVAGGVGEVLSKGADIGRRAFGWKPSGDAARIGESLPKAPGTAPIQSANDLVRYLAGEGEARAVGAFKNSQGMIEEGLRKQTQLSAADLTRQNMLRLAKGKAPKGQPQNVEDLVFSKVEISPKVVEAVPELFPKGEARGYTIGQLMENVQEMGRASFKDGRLKNSTRAGSIADDRRMLVDEVTRLIKEYGGEAGPQLAKTFTDMNKNFAEQMSVIRALGDPSKIMKGNSVDQAKLVVEVTKHYKDLTGKAPENIEKLISSVTRGIGRLDASDEAGKAFGQILGTTIRKPPRYVGTGVSPAAPTAVAAPAAGRMLETFGGK